jgi:predicted AAA+ superfamily ATPase
MRFGGFPEPLLARSERTLRRWQRERFDRVFREDIRELEAVRSLSQVELLGQMLEPRVARTLSVSSLAEDLEASPKTVKNWLELLCRNYFIFRVPPFHRRLDRALKKESKYYLWDWSEVRDEGRRFENLVAVHLLKFCHYHEDAFGVRAELYYIRDREKREVDFLVVWDGTPWMAVECKVQTPKRATHLRYYAGKLHVPQRFLVTLRGEDYLERASGIRFIPAARFLMALA